MKLESNCWTESGGKSLEDCGSIFKSEGSTGKLVSRSFFGLK